MTEEEEKSTDQPTEPSPDNGEDTGGGDQPSEEPKPEEGNGEDKPAEGNGEEKSE